MVSEDFKKKVKDFFSMLWGLCLLVLISGVTFVCGYMLGLNRVSIPYLSTYIKVPEEKAASSAVSTTATSTTSASTSYVKSANSLTEEQMQGKYKRFKFSPYNEARFNFSAILPNDWNPVPPSITLEGGTLMENLEKNKNTQIPLAEVDAPGAQEAVIQAWALNVPTHVDLDKFYKKVSSALNGSITEETPEIGGRKNVLIKYKTADGKAMLARSVAVRAGDYIMYLNCCGREDEFSSLSDMFNLVALSFSPDQASGLSPFESKLPDATGTAAVIK